MGNYFLERRKAYLKPNSIGVKYSLIVLGEGAIFTMSLFWPPYWSKDISFKI